MELSLDTRMTVTIVGSESLSITLAPSQQCVVRPVEMSSVDHVGGRGDTWKRIAAMQTLSQQCVVRLIVTSSSGGVECHKESGKISKKRQQS